MKKLLFLSLTAFSILFSACSNASSESGDEKLAAEPFQKKIAENPTAKIIDVRTPQEFAGGRIQNAINIDWRGDNFNDEVSKLDKAEPVFVYCLSGGRSAAAAEAMRSMGFKKVYELMGGLMKWNAAGLPLVTDNSSVAVKTGMSTDDFQKLLKTDKLVLVDFYAEWCGPCKKMEPFLEELKAEMSDKLLIVRIDVDVNKLLAEQMRIDEIPDLRLYKKGEVVWNTIGFTTKEDMLTHIGEAQK